MSGEVREEFKSATKKDAVTGVLVALAVSSAIIGYIFYTYGVQTNYSFLPPASTETQINKTLLVEQPLPVDAPSITANNVVYTISLELNKPVLVKWVMASSLKGKMYPRLAEEIVNTSMQIDNGRFTLLLLALMKRESNFYVFHVSKAGAAGLGQFMPNTIKQMVEWGWLKTPMEVYDPKEHIPAIVKFLKKKGMREDGSNIDKALFNYFGGKLNPDAAKSYIKSVKANMGDLVIALMSARDHDNKKAEVNNAGSKSDGVSNSNISS